MATNPFRYGALALDDAFTDRHAELAELVADVRNGQDVVIVAPRRYGKSSLVWRAAQRLVRERVLIAQVNLMTTPTKEKLAEKLAETIHDDIASTLFRAKERLRVFAGLRITQGEELIGSWKPPDGFAKEFCTACGSALWSRNDEGEIGGVRLGVLDDDPGVRPAHRQFVAYAAVWEPIPDDGLERFPEGRT